MNTDSQSNWNFVTSNLLPDGNGGWTPMPALLTPDEAIRYLRLDTIKIKNPDATLRRYREAGQLKAVQISKRVFYPKKELDSFIQRLTEENPR